MTWAKKRLTGEKVQKKGKIKLHHLSLGPGLWNQQNTANGAPLYF